VIPVKTWRPVRRRAVALAIGLALQGGLAGGFLGGRLGEVLGTSTARAFDAATTHAGLTQRAAVASHLHHILSRSSSAAS
jgi:hypothetical protein